MMNFFLNQRLSFSEKEKKRLFAPINQVFKIRVYYRLANVANVHLSCMQKRQCLCLKETHKI